MGEGYSALASASEFRRCWVRVMPGVEHDPNITLIQLRLASKLASLRTLLPSREKGLSLQTCRAIL
ncbi:hypothetical protein D3876_17340 [Sphingomonas cavernae]|uniref:Uncharacterized protein n=1 Tax=Sphingomonas cavernae TaxID=2320861 RepID=A0A418W6K4_9SPHN|nr:hypothetical protein D3876_17340 [Sphingomonas cavernae]